MCTQVAVDGDELATAPGKLVPVFLSDTRIRVQLPLSKSVFAREEHLRRMWKALPCPDEHAAREAAKTHVTREHGGVQVPWIYSAFARGFIEGVTRFAEKNPDFDDAYPVNEETNPFHLWFDAPAGKVIPIVLSVDAFRWSDKRRDGLRVVASIVTRTASLILPEEIHGREPLFVNAEAWARGDLRG